MEHRTVDVDGHVAEPVKLMMDEYLDPEYKDRPMQFLLDDKGLEYLEIDGKTSEIVHGGAGLGLDAGKAFGVEDQSQFFDPGKMHYYDGMIPASNEPEARLKWMNEEKVGKSLFYPTAGLFWEDGCEDPKVAGAYCRAYNDWLIDFCKTDPERLIPIAHLPTRDVNEAVKEAKRVAKMGAKGFMICAVPLSGNLYGSKYYDPLYAEIQETGLPLSIHPTSHHDYPGNDDFGDTNGLTQFLHQDFWYSLTIDPFPLQMALLNMINRGAFDRFPELKVVFLETGATWIIFWLERMNDRWETGKYTCPFDLKPSEYFERQCWISLEPDETLISHVIKEVGAHKFFWATDFPHADGFPGIVGRVKEAIESLSETDQRKILGENALEVYNLN